MDFIDSLDSLKLQSLSASQLSKDKLLRKLTLNADSDSYLRLRSLFSYYGISNDYTSVLLEKLLYSGQCKAIDKCTELTKLAIKNSGNGTIPIHKLGLKM